MSSVCSTVSVGTTSVWCETNVLWWSRRPAPFRTSCDLSTCNFSRLSTIGHDSLSRKLSSPADELLELLESFSDDSIWKNWLGTWTDEGPSKTVIYELRVTSSFEDESSAGERGRGLSESSLCGTEREGLGVSANGIFERSSAFSNVKVGSTRVWCESTVLWWYEGSALLRTSGNFSTWILSSVVRFGHDWLSRISPSLADENSLSSTELVDSLSDVSMWQNWCGIWNDERSLKAVL